MGIRDDDDDDDEEDVDLKVFKHLAGINTVSLSSAVYFIFHASLK